MWQAVVERFEQHAPACVMARLALEQALPAAWGDEVFEANRQRQYPRELMFSTIVELMTLVTLVTLGLRPSTLLNFEWVMRAPGCRALGV